MKKGPVQFPQVEPDGEVVQGVELAYRLTGGKKTASQLTVKYTAFGSEN